MSPPAPSVLKHLEQIAKRALARLAILLFARPGRRRRLEAALRAPRSVLLVRLDNRVGEALLTTPLLSTLKALPSPPRVELLTHPRVRAVLEGHPSLDALHTLSRRDTWAGVFSPVLRKLRASRFDLVVNCANWSAPSVTSALVARLAAPRSALVGPATPPIDGLQDLSISPRTDTASEALQRLHLLSCIRALEPVSTLSFRKPRVPPDVSELLASLGGSPFAVVNPGGRLGWRRVPLWVFRDAGRLLRERGFSVVLTWGPGEEGMARELLRSLPEARVAPPTDIDALAALMSNAQITVCNNTGPMHLAVSVGCPTVGLFLHMDVGRWGHNHPPHAMLDLTPVVANPQAIQALLRSAFSSALRENDNREL